MRSFLDFSPIRWLYPLLAIVALMVLDQAAGHAQGPRATRSGMSRPQTSGTLAMPPFSPNAAVHLGMIPMLSAYGMARPMQTGRMNPYGAGTSYGGSGGYGGSQGYMQGYPGSREGATAGSEGYTAEPQPDRQEKSWNRLLTASGVPNDNGQLRWPLGLRILAAPETDELRERISALFEEAGRQTPGGPVSSLLIQEMDESVKKFRKLLLKDKAERFGMPLTVYNESERFLNQLEHATQVLRAGPQASGGQDRLMTTSPSPGPAQEQSMAEVGIYDNSFQPQTVTVPVGATIQWINHGQHRHTVRADDGQWSSMPLNVKGSYTHTFARAGRYSYHCAVHPQEMRGTIIVK